MRKNNHRTILATALALAATLGIGACGLFGPPFDPPPPLTPPVPKEVTLINQGPKWDQANRAAFYSQDQGSRIMPLTWFKALRMSDNTPLTADGLARYGYLGNPDSPAGLPVGFTTGNWPNTTPNTEYVGMTCAACHTRQIRVAGAYHRIDGGPALSDLYGLFAEMDSSVQRVLASDANFTAFAADVLGKGAPPAPVAQLRAEVTAWADPYHKLITGALRGIKPWGVGRADAVGMILNRLGGLDIGTTPNHVDVRNIRGAEAQVRYPFLWNAPIQDKTQWPGFAPNGNDLFGLIRNLGEVYGVFAMFRPQPRPGWVGGVDYISVNSGYFQGLDRVEQMARRIGKPDWPWGVNQSLRAQGEKLFTRPDQNGTSCATCHRIQSQPVPFLPTTWNTPLSDVGTDSREYATLQWQGYSGVMEGGYLLSPLEPRIKSQDLLRTILATATAGAILQEAGLRKDPLSTSLSLLLKDPKKNQPLVVNALRAPAPATTEFKYEARVLQGIWAAAPYLHNGSVPTLADLLEPCDKRPAHFDVGIDYDTTKLGLAQTQSGPLRSTTETTEARDSGNSRCGHEQAGVGFGTTWTPDEKQALLEYLKIL